jgi:CRP-like cAMP-binding protein
MIAIMSPPHVQRLLDLSERDAAFGDGQRVFSSGDAVRYLFVVRQGGVRMLRRHPKGAALVLQRVAPGELLAEASLFAQHYHCDAEAQGPTLLARVAKARVLSLQQAEPGWLRDFAAHLAAEVQRARARAELLGKKRVSERVEAWFSLHGPEMPERGRWAGWADELGVSPEALYRELSKRRA